MKKTTRRSFRTNAARAAALLAAVLLPACYSYDAMTLEVTATTPTSITVTWNSPLIYFDDGSPTDHADSFELRYSDQVDAIFEEMTLYEGTMPEPTLEQDPKPSVTVGGLQANTTYVFVVRGHYYSDYYGSTMTADSNAAQGTTAYDPTPPGTITDLAGAGSTESSITLKWTAPGEDDTLGQVKSYDLRYSTSGPIVTEEDFEKALLATGEPAPQMAGGSEQITLYALPSNTTFHFAIRASDDGGNKSSLAPMSTMAATLPGNGINHAGGDARGCGGSAAGRGLPAGLALIVLVAALGSSRR